MTRREVGAADSRDDEAADGLIRDALATADQYGYGGLVPRAERLLARR